MKPILSLILFIALVPAFTGSVFAQDDEREASSATQSVGDVRNQLNEVQAKEAALQARAKKLEEDLKPENIERSFAGVGSTKPEDLREFRKRQLNIELEGVRKQLTILATSRERLQTVLSTAEARAYQQSADGSLNQLTAQNVSNSWLGLLVLAALTFLASLVTLVIVRRRALQ